MPTWLTIVTAVIGLFGTILGILGITAYVSERMKHKASRRNLEEDREQLERERFQMEERLDEIRGVVKDVVNPLKEGLLEVKKDLVLVKKGAQATCRYDLEELYAIVEKEGYCSDEDKQKFEDIYQAYHALGKNGVMDAKRTKLLSMPEQKK